MQAFPKVSSLRKLDRLALLLPTGLLAGIALIQPWAVQLLDLSPWKGGGFGMFSSINSPNDRIILFQALDSTGQELRLQIPVELTPLEKRARFTPRGNSFDLLADRLFDGYSQFELVDSNQSILQEDLVQFELRLLQGNWNSATNTYSFETTLTRTKAQP